MVQNEIPSVFLFCEMVWSRILSIFTFRRMVRNKFPMFFSSAKWFGTEFQAFLSSATEFRAYSISQNKRYSDGVNKNFCLPFCVEFFILENGNHSVCSGGGGVVLMLNVWLNEWNSVVLKILHIPFIYLEKKSH